MLGDLGVLKHLHIVLAAHYIKKSKKNKRRTGSRLKSTLG